MWVRAYSERERPRTASATVYVPWRQNQRSVWSRLRVSECLVQVEGVVLGLEERVQHAVDEGFVRGGPRAMVAEHVCLADGDWGRVGCGGAHDPPGADVDVDTLDVRGRGVCCWVVVAEKDVEGAPGGAKEVGPAPVAEGGLVDRRQNREHIKTEGVERRVVVGDLRVVILLGLGRLRRGV
jgi:hypothetical protein